ncbi:MAG: tetratricopeptide repeat protein [Deltaproteobacteria bacterium]|nr:tetratricopeptide repeat protein [Deltaproteobacteria bacterium]
MLARMTGILLLGAVLCAACGGSQVDEKARIQSDRFYEAAYGSWFEQHDNLAAIRNLTRSIETDPENDRAHYLLGTIRLGRGELDEAETHLREAVRLRGTEQPAARAEAENSLGVLLIEKKQYAEAVRVLSASAGEVLNREPWLAMGNLGWAHIELGEYDKAVEVLRRALFDQPRFCVGLYRLGQAFYLKKDYAAAENSLRQAIAVPDSGCADMQEAQYYLGLTLMRLGRAEESAPFFAKCRDVDPLSETGRLCAEADR